MGNLIAFHGDVAVKEKYLGRVRAHRALDELVQGHGYENSGGRIKACAIGCTLEAYDHSRYPIELGIPQVLARLEDRIFEALPNAEAMKWPEAFLSAVPIGADLGKVWPQLAAWMLRQCIGFTSNEEVHGILGRVAFLYETEVPYGDQRWRDARDEAYRIRSTYAAADADAAAAAAYAAYAADADAAAAAAYAAYAYAAAAAAAAAAYDAYDARIAFWRATSTELLRLMASAPVSK